MSEQNRSLEEIKQECEEAAIALANFLRDCNGPIVRI